MSLSSLRHCLIPILTPLLSSGFPKSRTTPQTPPWSLSAPRSTPGNPKLPRMKRASSGTPKLLNSARRSGNIQSLATSSAQRCTRRISETCSIRPSGAFFPLDPAIFIITTNPSLSSLFLSTGHVSRNQTPKRKSRASVLSCNRPARLYHPTS